jgi:hypothetical protein
MKGRKRLFRDFHAGEYLDLFLVSAVSAVLGIRFYLWITDYPTVGGDSLHIAHMLWGGLLMLAAMVVLLSFLGRRSHHVAAVLGGLGFGTFIDEVGKFLTHDNDYFYRPAIALIYVVFVLTYLVIRAIHRNQEPTREEYLVNALQELENVAVGDLDRRERDRALRYLARSDPADPLVEVLQELLGRTDLVPTPSPGPFVRLRREAIQRYRRLVALPGFPRVVIAFFVAQLLLKITHVAAMLLWDAPMIGFAPSLPAIERAAEEFSLIDWALIGSSALSALFVLGGIAWIRYSRLRALQLFQRSILVSVLLTQVFIFYRDQWAALTGLAFNLLVLLALGFMIEREGSPVAPPSPRRPSLTLLRRRG